MHQQDPRGDPGLGQTGGQTVQITAHDRQQQRVQYGGRGTFEFADLGADINRQRYRQRREPFCQPITQQPFVPIIQVGIQQRYRHRLGTRGLDPRGQRFKRGDIQRPVHRAIAAQPFGHAKAAVAADQRRLALLADVLDVAPGMAADFQNVLEPGGGQQHTLRQLAFQNGIGGDRGAMHQQPDIA